MNQFRSTPLPTKLPAATRRAIQRVVRAALPRLADFALAYAVDGSAIACIATAHVTAAGTRLVRVLGRIHRVRRSNRISSVAEVVRTGRPVLRTGIQAERTGSAARSIDDVVDLHRRLAPRSALVVPIAGPHATLGALSLCYSESGRRYTLQDLPAASQLARRIGRLLSSAPADATLRLRAAAGDTRPGTAFRRRVVSRD